MFYVKIRTLQLKAANSIRGNSHYPFMGLFCPNSLDEPYNTLFRKHREILNASLLSSIRIRTINDINFEKSRLLGCDVVWIF
jgi:hypothetical protein